VSAVRQGSAIAFDPGQPVRYDLRTRDGLALATDVYVPSLRGQALPGRFPALLERTPYSRRRPFLVQTARYFARRGYAVALQDVRGRFDSEGTWRFLDAAEAPDGFDTVAWIAAQPWCNGVIGTMGLSFSTANQQALAVLRPPGLATQFLLDGGYSYYHRTVRHNGAFELGVMLPYAYRTAREGRELTRDPAARREFERAFADYGTWLRQLSFQEGSLPLRLAPTYERWFLDAQRRADYDDSWKHPGLSLAEHIDAYPDIPVALEASWYGHHVWATTQKFAALRRRLSRPVHLWLGPWLHGYDDFARTFAGDVDFGVNATIELNDVRLRWFDQFMKGFDTGVLEEAPVRFFVMGGGSGRRTLDGRLDHGGRWRDASDWPPPDTRMTPLYLLPGGGLDERPPPEAFPPSEYVFDPSDPVPTIGGGTQASLLPGFIQGGGFDQRGRSDLWVCRDTEPLANRPDVLVFQSAPLEGDAEIAGPVVVQLWVASSAVDTDFTAKLIDVYPPSDDYPGGYALNLTDGILRMRYRGFDRPSLLVSGGVYGVTLELQATANRFVRGHRIRLDISSSNFPRFDVNPNTGELPGAHTRLARARQQIFHDASRPSHVLLPMVKT
jgi:putative CocE/NonD family hydrolase